MYDYTEHEETEQQMEMATAKMTDCFSPNFD